MVLAGVLASATATGAAEPARAYAISGECAGRPATTVRMAPGLCLGLVWQGAGSEGPRMPRGLMPLDDGDWLVTDLGGWQAGRGGVWRLSFAADGAARWRRLAGGLSMPHTVARGPGGRGVDEHLIASELCEPGRRGQRAHPIPVGPQRLHDGRADQALDIGTRGVMRTELRPLLGVERAFQQSAEDGRFHLGPDVLASLDQHFQLFRI